MDLSVNAVTRLRVINLQDAFDPTQFRAWMLDRDTFLWNSRGRVHLVTYDGIARNVKEITLHDILNILQKDNDNDVFM